MDKIEKSSYIRKLFPLAVSQTLGVYNDNAFKSLLVFIAIDYAKSYSQNSFFLALMTVVFVSPFIILTVPAGFCADKFQKKNILISSKFAEAVIMLIGAVLLAFVGNVGIYPLVIVLFLMAGQSSFFSPALNSILPETFSENEISKANGVIIMFNFIAVIIGFASGVILKAIFYKHYFYCGVFFTVVGLIGFLFSLFIIKTKPAHQTHWNNNILKVFIDNFKLSTRRKSVFVSILGEAYFYGIGASIQSVIILFGRFTLKLKSDLDLGILQIVLAVGIAFGCYIGGRLSRDKLELGLVPYGSIGISFFLILTAIIHGPVYHYTLGAHSMSIYPYNLTLLALAGICGGIFVIPLKVCQQERTKENERGRILAISNFCSFTVILFSGVITFILTGKSDLTENATSKLVTSLNSLMFNFSPGIVIFIISALTITMTIIALYVHREFILRALSVFITRIFYKVKLAGLENIPNSGPGVIVSNHVTLIDPLLITSCFSREVTFILHDDCKKHKFFLFIYKRCSFIHLPIDRKSRVYRENIIRIKKLLKRGELLCMFPEKNITRDGMVGEFYNNFKDIMPKHLKVPIIPTFMGNLWGSLFSYYFRERSELAIPEKIFWTLSIKFGTCFYDRNITPFQLRQRICEVPSDFLAENPRMYERPLHSHFIRLAKTSPLRKISTDSDGKSLPAFLMLGKALLLSKKIRELNCESKYIGVMLPNCNLSAVTMLAVMLADKVPAIINFTLPKESRDLACQKARVDTIITSQQFMLRLRMDTYAKVVFLEELAKTIQKKDILRAFSKAAFIPSRFLERKVSPKTYNNVFGTAVLLFSSGSSGTPKGILLSHHNMNSDIISFSKLLAFSRKDVICGNLPLFHSFGLNICFWMPMLLGIKVIYIKNPLEISTIAGVISKFKVTMIMGTPTFLHGYMKKISEEAMKSVRIVIAGAEKMRKELSDKFFDKYGLAMTEGYGCTELSPVVTANLPESIRDLGKKIGKEGSIGRALPGISVKAVHPETFEDLPENTEGLLFVRGPNVMQGYLNDPEKTKSAINKNGWYNTGDMVKIDEKGFITITGRLSRFSKIAGEMISHQMLELSINRIINAAEPIIAVTGAKDKAKGEKIIVFYTDDDLDVDQIIKELKIMGVTNIAIPRKENFIKIEELPMLGTGKLDLCKLQEIASLYST